MRRNRILKIRESGCVRLISFTFDILLGPISEFACKHTRKLNFLSKYVLLPNEASSLPMQLLGHINELLTWIEVQMKKLSISSNTIFSCGVLKTCLHCIFHTNSVVEFIFFLPALISYFNFPQFILNHLCLISG